ELSIWTRTRPMPPDLVAVVGGGGVGPVLARIHQIGGGQSAQVSGGCRLIRPHADSLHALDTESGQDREDGESHQEFDQGETAEEGGRTLHGIREASIPPPNGNSGRDAQRAVLPKGL